MVECDDTDAVIVDGEPPLFAISGALFMLWKWVWGSYDFGAVTTLAINVSVIVDGVSRGREQPSFVGGGIGLSSLFPR